MDLFSDGNKRGEINVAICQIFSMIRSLRIKTGDTFYYVSVEKRRKLHGSKRQQHVRSNGVKGNKHTEKRSILKLLFW